MPEGRNHATFGTDGLLMVVIGGRIGGNVPINGYDNLQVYNPLENSWDNLTLYQPMPTPRGGTGPAVYCPSKKTFLVMGGETTNGEGATSDNVFPQVEEFSLVENNWRSLSPLPVPLHGLSAVLRPGIHLPSQIKSLSQPYPPKPPYAEIWIAGGGVVKGNSQSATVQVLENYHCF